jgi:hypothetical protein
MSDLIGPVPPSVREEMDLGGAGGRRLGPPPGQTSAAGVYDPADSQAGAEAAFAAGYAQESARESAASPAGGGDPGVVMLPGMEDLAALGMPGAEVPGGHGAQEAGPGKSNYGS